MRKPYIRTLDSKKHLLNIYIESLHMFIGTSLTSRWVRIGSKVLTPQKSRDPREDGEPLSFRLHLFQQRGQDMDNNRSTNGQIQSAHSSWCLATVVCSQANTFLSSAGALFP